MNNDAAGGSQIPGGIVRRVCFLLASIIFLLGLCSLLKDTGIRTYADTYLYIKLASKALMDMAIGMRPFFSVALFKMVSSDQQSYVKLQFVVYAAGWLWLLYAVTTSARRALFAALPCAIVIYFALNPLFSLWINAVLTEAITVGAMALVAGFFIAYQRSGRTVHLTGAAIALVFLSNYKDLTAYYALLWLAPFLLVAKAKKCRIGPALLFAAVVSCASFFALWSAENVGKEAPETRWYFSMLNNIGKRVLFNDQFTAFFEGHGMPSSPALQEFRGNYGSDRELTVYKNPELEDFRKWLRKDGKAVYVKLLLSFPAYALAPLFSSDGDIFQEDFRWLQWYEPAGFNAKAIPLPNFPLIFFCNLSLCIFIAACARLNRNKKSVLTALAAFAILLIGPAIGLLAYHADAMEVTRHELPALAHMALSAVILLTLASNDMLTETPRLWQAMALSLAAIAGAFYLLSSKAYHAEWASTRFGAPAASYTWNGCMLPTNVGRANDKCEMIKAAPYRSGHLTYGPYEPLPAGTYRAEIGYSSTEKDIAGDWDISIAYPGNTDLVAKGLLHGTQGENGKVTGEFTVKEATFMGKVEIHTFSHHHLDLKVSYVRLTRLR